MLLTKHTILTLCGLAILVSCSSVGDSGADDQVRSFAWSDRSRPLSFPGPLVEGDSTMDLKSLRLIANLATENLTVFTSQPTIHCSPTSQKHPTCLNSKGLRSSKHGARNWETSRTKPSTCAECTTRVPKPKFRMFLVDGTPRSWVINTSFLQWPGTRSVRRRGW